MPNTPQAPAPEDEAINNEGGKKKKTKDSRGQKGITMEVSYLFIHAFVLAVKIQDRFVVSVVMENLLLPLLANVHDFECPWHLSSYSCIPFANQFKLHRFFVKSKGSEATDENEACKGTTSERCRLCLCQ